MANSYPPNAPPQPPSPPPSPGSPEGDYEDPSSITLSDQAAALVRIASVLGTGPGTACDLSSWVLGANPCEWQTPRVACSSTGGSDGGPTVVALDLSQCTGPLRNLTDEAGATSTYVGGAPLPAAELVTLVDLSQLSLRNTAVQGALPRGLSRLTALRFVDLALVPADVSAGAGGAVLTGSGLNGTLPDAWSALVSLEQLSLHGARLTGGLPRAYSALTRLQGLDLSADMSVQSAGLSGQLPSEWSALGALSLVVFRGQQGLTGPLPVDWANGMHSLQVIDVSGCRLSGPLPPQWSALRALQELHADNNSFSGRLPPEWGQGLAALRQLTVQYCRLEGTLPPQWSALGALQVLDGSGNTLLSGALPTPYSTMAALRVLDLERCSLNGEGGESGKV